MSNCFELKIIAFNFLSKNVLLQQHKLGFDKINSVCIVCKKIMVFYENILIFKKKSFSLRKKQKNLYCLIYFLL